MSIVGLMRNSLLYQQKSSPFDVGEKIATSRIIILFKKIIECMLGGGWYSVSESWFAMAQRTVDTLRSHSQSVELMNDEKKIRCTIIRQQENILTTSTVIEGKMRRSPTFGLNIE